MINILGKFFILIFKILLNIVSFLIIYPLQVIFESMIPNFDSYISSSSAFLINTVFPYVGFLKNVLINLLHINNDFFVMIVYFFSSLILASLSLRIVILIKNVWAIFRGGKE